MDNKDDEWIPQSDGILILNFIGCSWSNLGQIGCTMAILEVIVGIKASSKSIDFRLAFTESHERGQITMPLTLRLRGLIDHSFLNAPWLHSYLEQLDQKIRKPIC